MPTRWALAQPHHRRFSARTDVTELNATAPWMPATTQPSSLVASNLALRSSWLVGKSGWVLAF